jgi:hypothetical protein
MSHTLDGVSTVALLLLFSFAIERIVSAVRFLAAWAGWFDPDAESNAAKRRDRERTGAVLAFLLATALSIVILTVFDLHGVLFILGVKQEPLLWDYFLTVLVMVAGADRLGELFKASGTKLEAKLEQPLEVTGTLRLDPASADRLARAAEAKD